MLGAPDRPAKLVHGAFHAYVRSVFADRSVRAHLLHVRRMHWLRRVAEQASVVAEQRWEGEGGSTRRDSALAPPQT